jgi:hypothetical protein
MEGIPLDSSHRVRLENDLIQADCDTGTGALVALRNKRTGWEIQERPELAQSFRMVVPLPDRLLNIADRRGQKALVRKESRWPEGHFRVGAGTNT